MTTIRPNIPNDLSMFDSLDTNHDNKISKNDNIDEVIKQALGIVDENGNETDVEIPRNTFKKYVLEHADKILKLFDKPFKLNNNEIQPIEQSKIPSQELENKKTKYEN